MRCADSFRRPPRRLPVVDVTASITIAVRIRSDLVPSGRQLGVRLIVLTSSFASEHTTSRGSNRYTSCLLYPGGVRAGRGLCRDLRDKPRARGRARGGGGGGREPQQGAGGKVWAERAELATPEKNRAMMITVRTRRQYFLSTAVVF